jgi:hypothetical protein
MGQCVPSLTTMSGSTSSKAQRTATSPESSVRTCIFVDTATSSIGCSICREATHTVLRVAVLVNNFLVLLLEMLTMLHRNYRQYFYKISLHQVLNVEPV